MGVTMTKGSDSDKSRVNCFMFLFMLCLITTVQGAANNIKITDDNWDQILEGEWMVEFFAPWCPACRNLQPIWDEFSTWSNDLDIKIGQVDITNSPGLSGRFMITALPTIYHIKDGVFRQYRSPRTKNDFLMFIEEKKWQELDPIPSWQSPSSYQMSILSQFYRLSMLLRNFMNTMTTEFGLPVWATYLLFGGATICLGLILGLLLVCVIDFVYPPKKPQLPASSGRSQSGSDDSKTENDGELTDDDEDLYEEDDGDKKEDEDMKEDDDDEEGGEGDIAEGDTEKSPSSASNSPKVNMRRRTKRAD